MKIATKKKYAFAVLAIIVLCIFKNLATLFINNWKNI